VAVDWDVLNYIIRINNEGCTIRNAFLRVDGKEAGQLGADGQQSNSPLYSVSISWLAFIVQVHYINRIDWIFR
jgi:hypothetical protein